MLLASGLASFSRRWATPCSPLHRPLPSPAGALGCVQVLRGDAELPGLSPSHQRGSSGARDKVILGARKREMGGSGRFSYTLLHFSFEKTT